MNPQTSVGQIATRYPGATRIFRAHKIDFCCGGERSLENACGTKYIDVCKDLAPLLVAKPEEDWNVHPTPLLITHIVEAYHVKHRIDLPEAIKLASKVEAVHTSNPECPKGLARQLEKMFGDMQTHMAQEEEVLFPAILENADKDWLASPIHALKDDHINLGKDIAELERLTHQYRLPAEACNTWKALYITVQNFVTDLTEHVSLENNILFPRTLGVK